MLRVLRELKASEIVVVISAMGKMTNAFESLVQTYFDEQEVSETESLGPAVDAQLKSIKAFHLRIIGDLGFEESDAIHKEIQQILDEARAFLSTNDSDSYDFVYD